MDRKFIMSALFFNFTSQRNLYPRFLRGNTGDRLETLAQCVE